MKLSKNFKKEFIQGFGITLMILGVILFFIVLSSLIVFATRYPLSRSCKDFFCKPSAMFLFQRTPEMEELHSEANYYKVTFTVHDKKQKFVTARTEEEAIRRATRRYSDYYLRNYVHDIQANRHQRP